MKERLRILFRQAYQNIINLMLSFNLMLFFLFCPYIQVGFKPLRRNHQWFLVSLVVALLTWGWSTFRSLALTTQFERQIARLPKRPSRRWDTLSSSSYHFFSNFNDVYGNLLYGYCKILFEFVKFPNFWFIFKHQNICDLTTAFKILLKFADVIWNFHCRKCFQ